jgi:hypothetical protein
VAGTSLPVDLVDLDRFPIHDQTLAAYVALVDAAREQYRARRNAVLPGFVRAGELASLRDECARLAPLGHRHADQLTVFLGVGQTDVPADDPRRRLLEHRSVTVAGDLIPPGSPLRRLYEWDPFTRFVADVAGEPHLFRSADRLSALNVSVMSDGDEIGWHFDPAAVAVTLVINGALAGGRLDVASGVSRVGGEARLAEVLAGARSSVDALDLAPGTLVIVSGQAAMRRVSPVSGGSPRFTAEFAYELAAGTVPPDAVRIGRYGRLARGRRD